MKPRLYVAVAAYIALAVSAQFTLEHPLRAAVWIFLAGLAIKTWIAAIRQ